MASWAVVNVFSAILDGGLGRFHEQLYALGRDYAERLSSSRSLIAWETRA